MIYVPEPYWEPERVFGLENRLNILATFGYVLTLYAIAMLAGLLLFRREPRRRVWPSAVALTVSVLVAVGYTVQVRDDVAAYDRASDIQARVLAFVDHAPRPPNDSTIYVFDMPGETAQRVPVFYDTWDLNGAVRVTLDNPSLRAYPVFEGSKLVCADGFIYPEILAGPYSRLDDWASTGKAQGLRSYAPPVYSGDQGAPYGKILFVDANTGATEFVRDRASCESAVAEFEPGPFRAPPDAPAATRSAPGPREPLNDLAAVNTTLPDGFKATIVVDGLPFSTAMALLPDGTLLVGVMEAGSGSAVYAFRAGEWGLGRAVTFADGLDQVTGILPYGDEVYVGVRGSILAMRDVDGDLVADERRTLIGDLPAAYPVHANNGMAIGPDGMLYFGVGSTCNACVETNPLAASILRCHPNGTGCAPFARGCGTCTTSRSIQRTERSLQQTMERKGLAVRRSRSRTRSTWSAKGATTAGRSAGAKARASTVRGRFPHSPRSSRMQHRPGSRSLPERPSRPPTATTSSSRSGATLVAACCASSRPGETTERMVRRPATSCA